ncbi:hypothetical protein CAPTEDRAFT_192062 [Capitella teleta]|uniref:Uncharacterized protein n=1 Tax=Capitella teleta TaxID=283909 RepID=R7TZD1_CAPTE|nr:hypothetical protein CAPTEDRAFT_192062 [Capitella teleta]|eukprot:ELT96756.1 hypothetical protein CAPTEDRAFT_192062 [Capitella teleta]
MAFAIVKNNSKGDAHRGHLPAQEIAVSEISPLAFKANECLHDYIAISKVTTTQPLGKFNHRRLDLSSKYSSSLHLLSRSRFATDQEPVKSRRESERRPTQEMTGSGSLPQDLKVDMQVPSAHSAKKGKRFLEKDASFHCPAPVMSEDED